MSSWFAGFVEKWLRPAAKITEPEILALWTRLRVVAFGILALVFLVVIFHARQDSTSAAPMAAHDWLMRLPLSWGTWLQVLFAWYMTVQAVDATRLAKWAFTWDEKDTEETKARKTLAWGVFLGLALVATALVFSKQLGV